MNCEPRVRVGCTDVRHWDHVRLHYELACDWPHDYECPHGEDDPCVDKQEDPQTDGSA